MEQLLAMGFPTEDAAAALRRTGNVQAAVDELTTGTQQQQQQQQQQQPPPPIGQAAAGPRTEHEAEEEGAGRQLRRWFSGLFAPSQPTPVFLLTSSHGGRAVCARGAQYEVPPRAEIPAGGSGRALTLGPVEGGGLCFLLDGRPDSSMAVRLREDPRLALEVNWRKMEVGNQVSLWGSNDPSHRQWACRFCLNSSDGTLSPVALSHIGAPAVPSGLALGIDSDGGSLILVLRTDVSRRLAFLPPAAMAERVDTLAQRQAEAAGALRAQATALCSAAMKASLRRDGFVRVPGCGVRCVLLGGRFD
jgi:hypothetical protein